MAKAICLPTFPVAKAMGYKKAFCKQPKKIITPTFKSGHKTISNWLQP